jgi:hypothetical protein
MENKINYSEMVNTATFVHVIDASCTFGNLVDGRKDSAIDKCLADLQKKGAEILNVKFGTGTVQSAEPKRFATFRICTIEYEASKRIY